MIAPTTVRFFDAEWEILGDKKELANTIVDITSIPADVLHDSRMMKRYSVAARLSWAADRVTTRREDAAYCLTGLFGIHIPLMYGERDNAFIRLQEEIIRTICDDSILAWEIDRKNKVQRRFLREFCCFV